MDLANSSWLRLLIVLCLALLAYGGVRLLLAALHRLLSRRIGNIEDRKRFETLDRALRYIANVALFVAVTVLLMSELGISVAPLLGAAGVVGIAVGFAAQSLVKDFFRGIVLLFENQIRLGDAVEIAGKAGTVEEVTLRFVRLRDGEGNVHFVSNGEITTVTNKSIGYSFANIDVRVPSTVDLDQVIAIMRDTGIDLRADPDFADRILEDFELSGINDWQEFSVAVRGRYKTLSGQAGGVRSEYLMRVRARLLAAGIPLFEPVTRLRA